MAMRDLKKRYYFFCIEVLHFEVMHSFVDRSFYIQWSAIIVHKTLEIKMLLQK